VVPFRGPRESNKQKNLTKSSNARYGWKRWNTWYFRGNDQHHKGFANARVRPLQSRHGTVIDSFVTGILNSDMTVAKSIHRATPHP
jgi:hypothetical protein